MTSSLCLVALHRGAGSLVSRLIRWQTRGPYSHASFYFPGYGVVEAREFKGVVKLPGFEPKKGEIIDLYHVDGLSDEAALRVRDWAFAQVGMKYDYPSVARFLSRRKASRDSADDWFCSELVFEGVTEVGEVPLLARIEPWAVDPNRLGTSPKLLPVVPEFLRP